MTLRELLKKATKIKRVGRAIDFGSGTDTQYTVIFVNEDDAIRIEALHSCAEELLNVVEAAENYTEHGYFMGGPPVQDDYDQLCAALAALKEKEGETMSGLVMKYFVLKPKGSDPYAIASRCALWAYADAIATENPELSRDLKEWWQKEADLCIAETTGMDRSGRRGESR